jgi:hypothetical protein
VVRTSMASARMAWTSMAVEAQHRGGVVGEASTWRRSEQRGGGVVGEAPTWRWSVRHRGECGGGVDADGCVAGK